MKPFTKIAAILFGIGALIHLFRLFSPFQIIIGNFEVPVWASIVFLVIVVVLWNRLWKESNK